MVGRARAPRAPRRLGGRAFAFAARLRYQMRMDHDEVIPVLDFGSQYAQLIARRVREAGVFSELVRPDVSLEELRARENVKGIILSGGPSSVYDPGAPKADERIFERSEERRVGKECRTRWARSR